MVRLHYMDALRAFAMLLGVYLHALLSYAKHGPSRWPMDPTNTSEINDLLILWIHSFRMPLFFIVAGFFAHFLIKMRGPDYFLSNRIKRIFIPLVVSLVILIPITLQPFAYYQEVLVNQNHRFSLFDYTFKLQYLRDFDLSHLWFLYYLVIFYLVTLLLFFARPFINKVGLLTDRYFKSVLGFRGLIYLSLSVMFIHYLLGQIVIDLTKFSYINPLPLVYHGFFFLFGWWLHSNQTVIKVFSGRALLSVVLGTLLMLPLVLFLSLFEATPQEGPFFLLACLISAFSTLLLCFGWIGIFHRFFNQYSKVMRYLSDASYWIYLVHVPIVVWLQIQFRPLEFLGVASKPLLITLIVFLTSLMVYQFIVRHTVIGYYLHGKRNTF